MNEIVTKIDEIIFPFWEKVMEFLLKGYYVIYASIAIIVCLLVLVGLIRVLRKTPKLFLFLVIVLCACSALAYFLVYKK